MKEWDRLLPHAQLTLNHLRASRRQPNLSAHAAALGAYNFDAHPLAPPGTKVLVHETSEQRGTFDLHGTEGWYVGPAVTTTDAIVATFLSPIVSALQSQFLGYHRTFLSPKSLLNIIYAKQCQICYIY